MQVLTAAGTSCSLIVNEKGELYACGTRNFRYGVLGQESVTWALETPKLISLPATARRIIQISSTFEHAAFVTEIGQVTSFFPLNQILLKNSGFGVVNRFENLRRLQK